MAFRGKNATIKKATRSKIYCRLLCYIYYFSTTTGYILTHKQSSPFLYVQCTVFRCLPFLSLSLLPTTCIVRLKTRHRERKKCLLLLPLLQYCNSTIYDFAQTDPARPLPNPHTHRVYPERKESSLRLCQHMWKWRRRKEDLE